MKVVAARKLNCGISHVANSAVRISHEHLFFRMGQSLILINYLYITALYLIKIQIMYLITMNLFSFYRITPSFSKIFPAQFPLREIEYPQ
jgi:flagellar biosynthesis protein FlhB